MFRQTSFLLSGLFLLAACAAWAGEEKEKGAPPKSIKELVEAMPGAALEDGVYLQSGDLKVQLSEVEKMEKTYLAARQKQNPDFKVEDDMRKELRKQVALQLLVKARVEKYVTDNKLAMTPEQFEKKMTQFKTEQAAAGQTYEAMLEERGVTDKEFRDNFRTKWLVEDSLAAKAEKIDTSDMALRRVSHILFMYKGSERAPETVTRTKEEAQKAAQDVLKKLEGGGKFADLAKESSDCPSKMQGGDLGAFPRKGAMVEPFSDAAYKLAKVGDLTGVVETPFGFHVIKLTAIVQPQEILFEKLVEQLVQESFSTAQLNQKMM